MYKYVYIYIYIYIYMYICICIHLIWHQKSFLFLAAYCASWVCISKKKQNKCRVRKQQVLWTCWTSPQPPLLLPPPSLTESHPQTYSCSFFQRQATSVTLKISVHATFQNNISTNRMSAERACFSARMCVHAYMHTLLRNKKAILRATLRYSHASKLLSTHISAGRHFLAALVKPVFPPHFFV